MNDSSIRYHLNDDCTPDARKGLKMKKVKSLKNWGIFELSQKEQKEHNFKFAVIHPDTMECGNATASDTDWECETLEDAISWIKNY